MILRAGRIVLAALATEVVAILALVAIVALFGPQEKVAAQQFAERVEGVGAGRSRAAGPPRRAGRAPGRRRRRRAPPARRGSGCRGRRSPVHRGPHARPGGEHGQVRGRRHGQVGAQPHQRGERRVVLGAQPVDQRGGHQIHGSLCANSDAEEEDHVAKRDRPERMTRLGPRCPMASTRSASCCAGSRIVLAVRGRRVPAGRGARPSTRTR